MKNFVYFGRCASAMLRKHRATAAAFCAVVIATAFMAGAARAQVSDVTKPSFGAWGCGQDTNCITDDTRRRQQLIAQNTQVAMQQAAAQSQVNSAQQCVQFGGRVVQTGPSSYTCQNNGQVQQTGGQVVTAQSGVMQSPQAQQCVAQGGRVIQTGPTSYTCQLGQTLQVGGQYLPSGYVQNRPQVPVCQIAPNGQVLSGGACADPHTGRVFAPCMQGVWVRAGVNNFQCIIPQSVNNGQQVVGYPPAGAYQPQVGYIPQQRQQQNVLSGALDGAMIGYAAQGNRDGLRDGAAAGAIRAVARNIFGF